jgi:hypothetical protein
MRLARDLKRRASVPRISLRKSIINLKHTQSRPRVYIESNFRHTQPPCSGRFTDHHLLEEDAYLTISCLRRAERELSLEFLTDDTVKRIRTAATYGNREQHDA